MRIYSVCSLSMYACDCVKNKYSHFEMCVFVCFHEFNFSHIEPHLGTIREEHLKGSTF